MSKTGGQSPASRDPRLRKIESHDQSGASPLSKPGPAQVCTGCKLVNERGRWRWGAPPVAELHSVLCPACKRIRERDPHGTLRLPPSFSAHAEEIRGMLKNLEEAERAEHPLERLMEVKDGPEGLLVTTTGVHLARRIASSLARRFHEKPRMRFEDGKERVLVDWKRE
jgi:hypothetical protein